MFLIPERSPLCERTRNLIMFISFLSLPESGGQIPGSSAQARVRPGMTGSSNHLKRARFARRQFNRDRIAWANVAAAYYDAHDSGFADHAAVLITAERCGEQARPKTFDLNTRIAQARDFDHRGVAES